VIQVLAHRLDLRMGGIGQCPIPAEISGGAIKLQALGRVHVHHKYAVVDRAGVLIQKNVELRRRGDGGILLE